MSQREIASHTNIPLGTAVEDFINQCYGLHEAFALSLKPAKASAAIKDKLMAMVRARQSQSGAPPPQ